VKLQSPKSAAQIRVCLQTSQTASTTQPLLQYAVGVLKVECIVVCAPHVSRLMLVGEVVSNMRCCLIDNWIRSIRDFARLAHEKTFDDKVAALCELNVRAQVENVVHSTVGQNAWRRRGS